MFWNYGWGFGWLIPLFWVAVILLIFRWSPRRYYRDRTDKTPEDVLADRFAHGDITEDEYKQKLDVLKKHAK